MFNINNTLKRAFSFCVILVLGLLINESLIAQQTLTITVLDNNTEEPLPFVKTFANSENVKMTDIDGTVELSLHQHDTVYFRFFDYKDTAVSYADLRVENIVYLSPKTTLLEEIVIRPGENPAHRIIQHVMDNRKANDPLRNDAFTYSSFTKFYLSPESDMPIQKDTVKDSVLLETLTRMEKQYFFLTETAAKRFYSPPNYDKELVTSYKVSGINNPLFATMANQFQSFSFYDNSFNINERSYINPIAPGGLRRYLFILEDTLVKGTDSTFTISFRPRKGKNFEGLKGYLYINTKGWAIERVIAEPYEETTFKIKTIQEYRYTSDHKWFPYQLRTEFEMKNVMFDSYHHLAGKSNVYISDVEFNNVPEKRFNAVKLQIDEGAAGNLEDLEKARKAKSTQKELNTYNIIDSLAKESNLDRLMGAFEILATGKLPVGKLSIPLQQLIDYNLHEGYRLGFGLETNNRFSKHVGFGGYFAYGTRDKSTKWGGKMDIHLHRERNLKLSFLYRDDVFERGGTDFQRDATDLTSNSMYRSFFINQMDRERKAGVTLGGFVTQNFRLQLVGDYRRISILDDYTFTQTPNFSPFDLAETGVIINWNIREKVMLLGDRRVSLGTKYPKLIFKAVKGWDNIFESQYDYYRLNLGIEQTFTIRGAGKLMVQSISGITVGDVPLPLLQMPFGTGRNWNLTVPNTFETMAPSEFFTDRHSALFLRYTFLPLKNKTSWTEPLFSIHSAAGIGQLNNREAHTNIDFAVHEKGYFESGLIVDNLIKFGFNGFGIGIFHRYGSHALPELADNFVYKLSLRFNL